LNVAKTSALLCSIAPTTPDAPNIVLDNLPINYKPTLCYLGINFDTRLNFREHVRIKVTKARRLLGATVGVLQRYQQKHIIGRIWSHIIKPIVSYGWFMCCGKTKAGDEQMEKLQLSAARASLNTYNDDSGLIMRLNWQTMSQLAQTQRLRLGYNYAYGFTKLPTCVYESFDPGVSRTRQQQHSLQLKCLAPSSRTEAYCRAGFKRIAENWNALPQAMVNQSRGQFKQTSKSNEQNQTQQTTHSRTLRSHHLL
jgi:hypothetical protein